MERKWIKGRVGMIGAILAFSFAVSAVLVALLEKAGIPTVVTIDTRWVMVVVLATYGVWLCEKSDNR